MQFYAIGRVTEQPHTRCPHCTCRQDNHFLHISTTCDWSVTSIMLRCCPRKHLCIDNSQPSSCMTALRKHSSQNSLDSGCSVFQCHLCWTRQQWSRNLLLPSKTAGDACGAGLFKTIWEVSCYGCGSVMVWGGIHFSGRTPLSCQGSLTGLHYRDETMCPPHPTHSARPGTTLQDGNTTPHNPVRLPARVRMDWPAPPLPALASNQC